MANKVIDEDFAKRLLAGERLEQPKTQSQPKREVIAQFADSYKPDPTKKPQAGYPQEGDKGDIWSQWKKQGRKGAAELIDRWGA